MHSEEQTGPTFSGFDVPHQNWFKLPHDWTGLTAQMASWAEQKVVEYVLRHTWGYQEYGGLKRISLDEFEHGRKRTDGTRMDQGIGMRKQAIIRGIRQAVADGFLVEEVDDTDKGRTKKYYGLCMMDQDSGSKSGSGAGGYDDHTPGVRASHITSMKNRQRTEKDTLERNSKKPLNGIFKQLPNLKQPKDKTEYIAQTIVDALGDEHSLRFYHLMAAKIPEEIIRRALAEVKADGAQHPARLYTYKMKQYVLQQRKAQIGVGASSAGFKKA